MQDIANNSKDQMGSRFVQSLFEDSNSEYKDKIVR